MAKTVHEGEWNYDPTPDGFDKATGKSHHERLWYPMGPDGKRTTRDQFNAPKAGEGWSATLVFGRGNGDMGGTIDVPDFQDLADFMGVSKTDIIYSILDKGEITRFPDGIEASSYTNWMLKHIHKDLGFFEEADHDWDDDFGGEGSVKAYIDEKINQATTIIENKYDDLIKQLIARINGGPTLDNGKLVWPSDSDGAMIPIGNINLFGDGSGTKYIKTHDGVRDGDVRTL